MMKVNDEASTKEIYNVVGATIRKVVLCSEYNTSDEITIFVTDKEDIQHTFLFDESDDFGEDLFILDAISAAPNIELVPLKPIRVTANCSYKGAAEGYLEIVGTNEKLINISEHYISPEFGLRVLSFSEKLFKDMSTIR